MKIEDIKNPKFLKDLSVLDLYQISDEIRQFILESVSKTGGHLSSNLGVVELTVALHYVFNAPRDKFLFDVGHQCYTHKILTGRAPLMSKIRQFGGISGFQKRNESEYDCFEAGHSSTSLSSALGMAVARDLNHENYQIVPIIGDGALFSGMSFEALNQIGYQKRKMVIIFNDNNMSISKNVGALSKTISKLRYSKGYNDLKNDVKEFINNKKIISNIHNLKKSIKNQVVNDSFFGDFNIDYLGPIDGHNIQDMINAFEVAKENDGPIVVHVLTKKGKGYAYTEADTSGKWHGCGKFDIKTGKSLVNTPEGYKSTSKVVADALGNIMEKNKDVVAITPAMIQGSALTQVFNKYPDRCFDGGIAEEHCMTFASGLALAGKRPFIAIYSTFLQRAYDQVNHDICRMNLPVFIAVDRAGVIPGDGDTHQGIFDISFLRSLPNMVIAQGKDAKEMSDLVYTGMSINCPFALRFEKTEIKAEDYKDLSNIKIGSWEYLNDLDNPGAVIITYGLNVNKLKDIIDSSSLNYDLINARFIKPIDEEMLLKAASKNVPIYVYTNEMIKGGLGEEILSFFNRKQINKQVFIYGIDDDYVPTGSVNQLLEYYHLDIKSFLKDIEKC